MIKFLTVEILIHVILFAACIYYQITKRSRQAPESRCRLIPASINSPFTCSGIDIIFIHGLGSDPDTARRAMHWVKDLLPGDLDVANKDVRLFFYDCGSYQKDGFISRVSILANELLQLIDRMLKFEQARRQLIFVAYSLGGLVIKQALVESSGRQEPNDITQYTKAILFLGTPHRGSSFSKWSRLAARALLPLGSNLSILAEIEYDSIPLLDLHRSFTGINRENLQVFNFFEQRPTRLLRLWCFQWQQLCVPEQSATYGGQNVENIPLFVDHPGLNKFSLRNDDNYRLILGRLRVLTTRSVPHPTLAHPNPPRPTPALPTAAPPTQSVKRRYAVPFNIVPAFTQRDKLWKLINEKLRIRHTGSSVPYAVSICGFRGAGKSQLALKYAESHQERYDPILWIDATDQETVRSSFERCAGELELAIHRSHRPGAALADSQVIQTTLRWLSDKTCDDNEWLVIIDNADDLSWGIKKIIPKGKQGSVIITSRDEMSQKLISHCEDVFVGIMSPLEGTSVILQHLKLDINSSSEHVRESCRKVAHKMGYLALAIDLAGACIGNHPKPQDALTNYPADYDTHQNKLSQMSIFRGLMPTEKTVWTICDITMERIARQNTSLQPYLLLAFLASFKGRIVQEEMLRLATLEIASNHDFRNLLNVIPRRLERFFTFKNGEWDKFYYLRSCDQLLRYGLLQRVEGEWPGMTMHGLVQWRALQQDSQLWQTWSKKFVVAVCSRIANDVNTPEFLQCLIAHMPDISEMKTHWVMNSEHLAFLASKLGLIYLKGGRWIEAENLYMQLLNNCEAELGNNHIQIMDSKSNLAWVYFQQGRRDEAEKIQVQIIKTSTKKLGAYHTRTLRFVSNLAVMYMSQGRRDEAAKIEMQVVKISKGKLAADDPERLRSVNILGIIFREQRRFSEAVTLLKEVYETYEAKLGTDHAMTVRSMHELGFSYMLQGRLQEAEELLLQSARIFKMKLGHDNYLTIMSDIRLAEFWKLQQRPDFVVEFKMEDCVERCHRVLGPQHPDTLSSVALLNKWRMERQ